MDPFSELFPMPLISPLAKRHRLYMAMAYFAGLQENNMDNLSIDKMYN